MQPQAQTQEESLQEYHPYSQIQFPLGSMGTLEVPNNNRNMPFQGLSVFRQNTEQIGEEQNEQQLGRGHVEEVVEQQQLATPGYHVPAGISVYPPPMAEHETLLASRQIFEELLNTFHGSLGRRLTAPNIEGQELDLYALYREVTGCGGLEQVIRDRRWNEVARALNFPGSVINPSFVLRKHYIDLLYHFEKIYYFKAHGQLPYPPGPLPAPLPIVKLMDDEIAYQLPVDSAQSTKRRRKIDPAQLFGVDPGASVGHIATGAIDGKFDNGYFVTMVVGSEKLHGILYHVPTENPSPQFANIPGLIKSVGSELDALGLQVQVTKKKKETAPKKDPNAPRPAKKSYNYFYAEQCPRLKKIHSQTHREIGRMVADLWNKLSDNEKLINKRGDSVDEKVKKLDIELARYKEQIKKTRPGPAQEAIKARAMRILKQKRIKWGERLQLLPFQLINYYVSEKYTLRYTGGMVPDVNQIIVKEKGVFTNVISPTSKAKLRLLFEVAPLGMLVEKAGRYISNGKQSVLDKLISFVDESTQVAVYMPTGRLADDIEKMSDSEVVNFAMLQRKKYVVILYI